jgi:hypothetical protein
MALMMISASTSSAQSAPPSPDQSAEDASREAFQATLEEDPPEIVNFSTRVDSSNLLTVSGTVAYPEPEGLTVLIEFIDEEISLSTDSLGDFFWQRQLEEGDEGWLDAVAWDQEGGQDSESVRDYIYYNIGGN